MTSKLIALASAERPGIMFKHVLINEIFVGQNGSIYQKTGEHRCQRIANKNGALDAKSNIGYAMEAPIRKIAPESFTIKF